MKFINKIKLFLLCLTVLTVSIAVVGCKKPDNGGDTTPPTPPTFEDYYDDSRIKDYQTFDNVTVDGKLSAEEWGSQNFYSETITIGGVPHDIEFSAIFAEEGLIMGVSVLGAPAFYNAGRGIRQNSGIEFYLAPGSATTTNGYAWEMQFLANGITGSSKRIKPGKNGSWKYVSCNQYMICETQIDGKLNDPDNLGYVLEYMIPWSALDLKEAPNHVCVDIAVMYCTSAVGDREAWVSSAQATRNNYSFSNPQGWHKVTKDGFFDDTEFGFWRSSKLDPAVEYMGNDETSFIYKHGFNAGDRYLELNRVVTEDNYQEVTIFNPKAYLPELADELADPSKESSLNGLLMKLKGGKNSGVQWAAHYDGDRSSGALGIRLQSGIWTAKIFTEAQLAKYNDPNKGLRIGMLNIGTKLYCYLENDDGNLELKAEYELKGRDEFTDSCERIIGIQLNTGGGFKDYRAYIGDELDTIPYEINKGQALVGGNVTVTGSIADGAMVEVTPATGYDIKSFKINGNVVESNYYVVPANSTPKLNIEVEFELSTAQKTSITFNVTGGYNYVEATPVSARVSFIGDAKSYGTIVDGALTIDLADGDYAVVVDGYYTQTITVTDGVVEGGANIVLSQKLFDTTNTDWTIAETTGGGYTIYSYKDDNHLEYDLDVIGIEDYISNGFVLDFTYKGYSSPNTKYYPAIILREDNGSYSSFQICQYTDDLHWKQGMPANESGVLYTFSSNYTGAVELTLKVVVSANYVSCFVKDGNSYKVVNEFRNIGDNVKALSINYINDYDTTVTPEEWSFEGFKISKLEQSTVTANQVNNGSITLSNNKPVYGETVTITVNTDPVSGDDEYVVNKILINGEELDIETVNGVATAKFVVDSLTPSNYTVSANVISAKFNDVTIAVKAGYPNVASTIAPIEDGKGVIIDGLFSAIAFVENGTITVSIPDGTYVARVADCLDATITITNGTLSEIVFAKKLLDADDLSMPGAGSKTNFTTSGYSTEKGYYVTSSNKDSIIAIETTDVDLTKDFQVKLHLKTTGVTSSSQIFPAVWAGGVDDANNPAYFNGQFCLWNGKLSWKNAGVNVQNTALTTTVGDINEDFTIQFRKDVDNGKYWGIYLIRQNGTECAVLTYSNTTVGKHSEANLTEKHYITSISQVSFYYTHDTLVGSWEFTNISIANITK